MSTVVITEQAAPGTPSAGQVVFYAKSDGKLYYKDDAGTETPFAGTGIQLTLIDAKGDLVVGTAADTADRLAAGANGTIPMARSADSKGLAYVAALSGTRYGHTYAHNAVDVTNDWDINAGGCMDVTKAYWITTTALTKQADVAWAVGNAAGLLDTGAVGNSDYYLFAIARSDTGVTDYLSSLSPTAPTMPASYDFKRLIGWFKRVGGVNVLMDVYETEGGGIDVRWRAPTLDVNLANTLTTSRRTDPVKVPLNFSTIAHLRITVQDSSLGHATNVCCPDETDVAPSYNTAPGAMFQTSGTAPNSGTGAQASIRTSAAGLIAARSSLATIDLYAVFTIGFTWARRN